MVNLEEWALLALIAGLVSAIGYYKGARLLAVAVVFAVPVVAAALFGWPTDTDFIHTASLAIITWAVGVFFGNMVATMAIVLRIVR